jgi:hypothetical protein
LARENVLPTISHFEAPRRDALEQARFLEVRAGPTDSIVQSLLSAREKFCLVIVGELKLFGHLLNGFRQRMLLAITRQLQQRKHQGLEVRDSHAECLPALKYENHS